MCFHIQSKVRVTPPCLVVVVVVVIVSSINSSSLVVILEVIQRETNSTAGISTCCFLNSMTGTDSCDVENIST